MPTADEDGYCEKMFLAHRRLPPATAPLPAMKTTSSHGWVRIGIVIVLSAWGLDFAAESLGPTNFAVKNSLDQKFLTVGFLTNH
jgi:hypothetical protein